MTWREKTVIRILLLVAELISPDEKMAKECKTLSNHITSGLDSVRGELSLSNGSNTRTS